MDAILIPVIIVVVIGFIAGVILTIASKVMAVSVDEKIEKLMAAMPGANCGACGYAGCDNYAVSLGEDKTKSLSTALCPVGGDSLSKELADILGVEAITSEPRVAYISCIGKRSEIKRIMVHDKKWSCKAASNLYGGQMECAHGCLGHGDCVASCPYDAIKVENYVAIIDKAKCIGCGICVSYCPKNVIKFAPKESLTYVGCSSTSKGADTRRSCQVGCIGCKKCEKICPDNAIKVDNFLASIDYNLCSDCGKCASVCPTTSIVKLIKTTIEPKKKFGKKN